ncbi:hypothetical protein [Actinokineospora diospyrosa]|uniref:Type I restriction enzyme S subunit n=1 Tax=Actinokineospora diospyrosa TaxID=103728 RepID=A0ABT1I9E5_9PSEU|nr:hypothetical protein [Actinokineospora diospyrosa]MCP2269178.1 hypothetical protein [Actinokineospora diospyrosa]
MRTEVPLDRLFEVMPGRNRAAKAVQERDPEFRVVQARDIGATVAEWAELARSTPHTRTSAVVLPGDIIGSVSGPHGRWGIVPARYGPALASDHTVVLRSRGTAGSRYLLGFLRSGLGRSRLNGIVSGVVPRISARDLRNILVPPCEGDPWLVDQVLDAFEKRVLAMDLQLRALRESAERVYDVEADFGTELGVVQGVAAAMRVSTDISQEVGMAKVAYPYPIARTLRALDGAVSPREEYHIVVHELVEALSVVLTALAAALARSAGGTGVGPLSDWAKAVNRRGATIGARHAALLAVAARAEQVARAEPVDGDGGLCQAFGREDLPAPAAMRALIDERNRIHGKHPRVPAEFRARLAAVHVDLRTLLRSLSFLARWRFGYVESVRPVAEDAAPTYRVQLRVLRGDNPVWAVEERTVTRLLFPGRTYALIDEDVLLDLHPYLVARECDECGAMEVYHPNSVGEGGDGGGSTVQLRSIDMGHTTECDDPALVQDVLRAFAELVERPGGAH